VENIAYLLLPQKGIILENNGGGKDGFITKFINIR
jgi:hypothetical protein